MQCGSVVARPAGGLKNPLFGSTLSYRVAPAPQRAPTATRDVITMARKKVRGGVVVCRQRAATRWH